MKRRDPIIDELHRVREDIGKAHDFDARRIAATIRQHEATEPRGPRPTIAQAGATSEESLIGHSSRTPELVDGSKPGCGGRVRLVALIEDAAVIRRILTIGSCPPRFQSLGLHGRHRSSSEPSGAKSKTTSPHLESHLCESRSRLENPSAGQRWLRDPRTCVLLLVDTPCRPSGSSALCNRGRANISVGGLGFGGTSSAESDKQRTVNPAPGPLCFLSSSAAVMQAMSVITGRC